MEPRASTEKGANLLSVRPTLSRLLTVQKREASPHPPPTVPPGTPEEDHSDVPSQFQHSEKRESRRRFISLKLANNGSVARDHLALERTFLAYVRTSLAVASAGVALMQFLRVGNTSKLYAAPLGATTICLALLVLLTGTRRYFAVQYSLVRGQFPVSRIGVAVTSVVLGALIASTFGIILANRLQVTS